MSKEDSMALVEALIQRVPGAEVRFFRHHYPKLVSHCRTLTRNEAEDLAMVVLEEFMLRYVHTLEQPRCAKTLLELMAVQRWQRFQKRQRDIPTGGLSEEELGRLRNPQWSTAKPESLPGKVPFANRAVETDERPRQQPGVPYDREDTVVHLTPDEVAISAQSLRILHDIIQGLSPRKREIMAVHIYQNGLNRREIGDICGVTGAYVGQVIAEVWELHRRRCGDN